MFSPTGERGTIHLIDLQSVNLAGEDFLFLSSSRLALVKERKGETHSGVGFPPRLREIPSAILTLCLYDEES